MLIYWSVPARLVTPGTESLTRHIDLLDAVTRTHLPLANFATLIFWMQSLAHISHSRILPNTNQFLLSLSAISRTSICFSRMRQFPTQVLSRLLQVQHERMRFTTRWWAAFRVKSFKMTVINLQVRGTLLIHIPNGRQSLNG